MGTRVPVIQVYHLVMSSYATPSDMVRFAINATALAAVSTGDKQAALDAASSYADSKLRGRFSLPLSAWGDDLRRVVCWIAAYDLMVVRGFNPILGADSLLRTRYDDAVKWLDGVERQNIHPDVTPAPDQSPKYDAPKVTTAAKRGW